MAGLPLFICDILAFCLKSRDNKGKAEVMTVLTFQAVLAIFGDYLSKDLEEEVLPCRRGYVRVSWNGEDQSDEAIIQTIRDHYWAERKKEEER